MSQQAVFTLSNLELITGEWVTLEGGIGCGKTTALTAWEDYVAENRCDATSEAHLTEEVAADRDFFLIVREPVKEWDEPRYDDTELDDEASKLRGVLALLNDVSSKPAKYGAEGAEGVRAALDLLIPLLSRHEAQVHGDQGTPRKKISSLKAFYRNPRKHALRFQVTAFTSRLRGFRDALNALPEAARGRRIHLVTERTMETDRLFFNAVCRSNPGLDMERDSYEGFFPLICDALNERTSVMIYLPVSVSTCQARQRRRDRLSETEEGIDPQYMHLLDELHGEMAARFANDARHPRRRLIRLDKWEQELSGEQVNATVRQLIQDIVRR